jgi:hypothetical protein
MPVILANVEAKTGGLQFRASPNKKVQETPSQLGWWYTSVIPTAQTGGL